MKKKVLAFAVASLMASTSALAGWDNIDIEYARAYDTDSCLNSSAMDDWAKAYDKKWGGPIATANAAAAAEALAKFRVWAAAHSTIKIKRNNRNPALLSAVDFKGDLTMKSVLITDAESDTSAFVDIDDVEARALAFWKYKATGLASAKAEAGAAAFSGSGAESLVKSLTKAANEVSVKATKVGGIKEFKAALVLNSQMYAKTESESYSVAFADAFAKAYALACTTHGCDVSKESADAQAAALAAAYAKAIVDAEVVVSTQAYYKAKGHPWRMNAKKRLPEVDLTSFANVDLWCKTKAKEVEEAYADADVPAEGPKQPVELTVEE